MMIAFILGFLTAIGVVILLVLLIASRFKMY